MEIQKEHKDQRRRQMEMNRIWENLLSSIHYHGLTPEVRIAVEKDMMDCWNQCYYEEITFVHLIDYISQVIECVFSKSEISVIRQRLSIGTDSMSKGEDDEPTRTSQ